MEPHLQALYEEMLDNAINFGCGNVKRRQAGAGVLQPRDMAVYLERTWNLYVPGFTANPVSHGTNVPVLVRGGVE